MPHTASSWKGLRPSASLRWLALVVCVVAVSGVAFAENTPALSAPLVTSVHVARQLSPGELITTPRRIRIRAVVTYYDTVAPNLFVQDSTGGIWVDLRGSQLQPPRVGQVLDIEGQLASGFGPYIATPTWTVVGNSAPPAAISLSYEQAATGAYDGQWVQMEGVVRSFVQQAEGNVLVIDVATPTGTFKVRVPDYHAGFPLHMVDEKVRFRGVCGAAFNRRNQLVAIHLFVPRLADAVVLDPSPSDPFAGPVTAIKDVARFGTSLGDIRRVKVAGVVTAGFPGRGLFLTDVTGGLYVESQDGTPAQAGDTVEVVGFPEKGSYTPLLRSANVRLTHRHQIIEPVPVTGSRALTGNYDAQLVTISGTVQAQSPHAGSSTLVINSEDDVAFEATLSVPRGRAPKLPAIGSIVQLTGVCSVKNDENGNPSGFQIVLRTPQDIVLISRPPWLSARRALLGLCIFAGLTFVVLGWVIILRNRVREQTELIKKRLEQEAALEQRYRRMFEHNLTGLYVCNGAGEIVDCNDACARILGFANREQLLASKPEAEKFIRDIHSNLRSEMGVSATNKVVSSERCFRRRDGTLGWALMTLSQVPMNGHGPFMEAALVDITDRKRYEDQLHLYAVVLETAANAIMITGRDGNIAWVNAAFTRLTGYSREEVLGKNPRFLKSGKQNPGFYASLWKTVQSGQTWHGELVNRKKDGELYLEEMTITPVLDRSGNIGHYIAIKQDITVRKALEDQLRQSQKMEAIGRLAGGVAHDFNNVLMVISSYTELLESDLKGDEKHKRYTDQIHNACKKAGSLTQELLAFSRKQVQQKKILSLNHVISESEKMLGTLVGEDVKLVIALADDLPPIMADPGHITQVLMNLAANARDAMPEGGALSICTRSVWLDQSACKERPGLQPGEHSVLVVTDTGMGFDDSVKARVFEPFFTTKPAGKGTGLGLATVYGIVKQSDGYIAVDSKVGQGTTFTIYFRSETAQNASAEDAPVKPGDLMKGHETILLIEDEPSLREALCEQLTEYGYTVLAAGNGSDALDAASQYPSLDLVITDFVLPDIRGAQLYEKVRAKIGAKKVIYMSGYAEPAALQNQLKDDNSAFLQKPFGFHALLKTIQSMLKPEAVAATASS